MKCRNIFGRLEYTMEKGDGKKLIVAHNRSGRYTVDSVGTWCTSRAVLLPIWDPAPVFDSWIKAIRFLKENFENLF